MPDAPLIILALPTHTVFGGIILGLNRVATEQGWRLDVARVGEIGRRVELFKPAAILVHDLHWRRQALAHPDIPVIGVHNDLAFAGHASVALDEEAVGRKAADHLLENGLTSFAAFGMAEHKFASRRAAAFRDRVEGAGGVFSGWGAGRARTIAKDLDEMLQQFDHWVGAVRRPAGIFVCCDPWGLIVLTNLKRIGAAVPDDFAVIGVDNSPMWCEITHPPLSSVVVPWSQIGSAAGTLLAEILAGNGDSMRKQVVIQPGEAVVRQSSDMLAVDDADVSAALRCIRKNAAKVIGVPDILREVPAARRTLERNFRRLVGRGITDEIRRVHVQCAQRLLLQTDLPIPQVARRSGFPNATSMGISFRKLLGTTPGHIRRSC